MLLRPLSATSDRLGNGFYVGLAIVLIAVAAVAILNGNTNAMKYKAYDLIMKYRIHAPAPDTEIVILDIDETALAAMATQYGRWPWPRSIMGELVDGITPQKPQAIVFDIAFSDPDVFNADSDRYFRDVVAHSANTYFPMIRLVPENDARSTLRINQLPGVTPFSAEALPEATVAMVLPYFVDVLTDSRLGTNNLLTDDDGVVRTYSVYANEYEWRVGSLPANVAQSLGVALPVAPEILLNWRGRPPSYRHISFHEVYLDLLKQKRTRPADEFAGKIVIIGSTAPALFDYKPSSMTKVHPGVEILATALDNLKNGDSLWELPRWIYVLITALAVGLLAVAFVYSVDQRVVTLAFTILQTGFLAVSYVFLNVSMVFVDLTAPFAFCLVYFTIARFNGMLSSYYRSGHPLFSALLDEGNECRIILVECRLHHRQRNARLRLGAELKKLAGRSRFAVVTPPLFKGIPLLHAFRHDSLLLYWSVPLAQEREAFDDLSILLERMVPIAEHAAARRHVSGAALVTIVVHSTTLKIDANDSWRDAGQRALAELMRMAEIHGAEGALRVQASTEVMEGYRKAGSTSPPILTPAS